MRERVRETEGYLHIDVVAREVGYHVGGSALSHLEAVFMITSRNVSNTPDRLDLQLSISLTQQAHQLLQGTILTVVTRR